MTAAAQSHTRKLPPFSKELIAARRSGVKLNVHLHAGDHAWRRAKYRHPPHVLCCPPDSNFEDFDWSCVRGLDITLIVWNRRWEEVDAFARHLVVSGSTLVAALGAFHDGGKITACESTFYRPTRAKAAA
ncbi:MAG: hypothetical protein ABI645_00525 [Pseudomonadota bacterium]